MFPPIPRLEATGPNVDPRLRGADALFNRIRFEDSASEEAINLIGGKRRARQGGEELEVAAITYLRVSGLEGLGSPIISGVGSILSPLTSPLSLLLARV